MMILEIVVMTALPFWSRLTVLCVENKVNQKCDAHSEFMFCLLNPLLFIFLFPSSLSQLLKLLVTLPCKTIPEMQGMLSLKNRWCDRKINVWLKGHPQVPTKRLLLPCGNHRIFKCAVQSFDAAVYILSVNSKLLNLDRSQQQVPIRWPGNGRGGFPKNGLKQFFKHSQKVLVGTK